MKAIEVLIERHEQEGGLSDNFTPLEKAVLYWWLREGDDSSAEDAAEELNNLYGASAANA